MRLTVTALAIIALLVLLATVTTIFAPAWLVNNSTIDLSGLSPAQHATAINTARTAVLTALGGLVATSAAFAALWQANSARQSLVSARAVEWAKCFAESSGMMAEPSHTQQIAGICALEKISHAGSETDKRNILLLIRSFVRNSGNFDASPEALAVAMRMLNEDKTSCSVLLSGANLSTLDLTHIELDKFDFSGVSLRHASIQADGKAYLRTFHNIDLGEVKWISSSH